MAANVSSYISAGNAAVKNAYQSLAAARDNSPKHGELVRKGMKARAKENMAAMKADAQVEVAKGKAEAHVKQYDIAAEGAKKVRDIKKGQQMAGKLASAAGMIALSSMPGPEQIKPRATDYSRSEALFRERLGEAEKDIKKFSDPNYQSDLDREFEALGTTPAAPINVPSAGATLSATGGTGWDRLGRTIRFAEGTSGDAGYNTMFTHAQFSDMSQHPRQLQTGGGYTSDAAGAYQFLSPTWDRAKSALGLQDFSPESQEKAGEWLAQQRGVDTSAIYTNKADFAQAIDRLAPEWASLPTAATGTSYYGQGGKNIDQLWAVYNQ